MSTLEARAKAFAEQAHRSIDQRRKYTGEPYEVHPVAVAEIVRSIPHDEAMLAAALLHDTAEDTPVTLDDVRNAFGDDVADLVGWLTDVSRPSDGNRRTRKAIDREHTSQAPARAQTIKAADIIDNCSTIMAHDPAFAKVWIAEKRLLLEVLTRADPTLLARARELLG